MISKQIEKMIFDRTVNKFQESEIDSEAKLEKFIDKRLWIEMHAYAKFKNIDVLNRPVDEMISLRTEILNIIKRAYDSQVMHVSLSDKNIEKLSDQCKENMHNAFWDLIADDLQQETIKTDHIIVLLEEIRDRIINLTPNNNSFREETLENINIKYLENLFKHKLFCNDSLQGIVGFIVEERLLKLCAPNYDKEIREWYNDICEEFKSVQPFHITVPKILKGVYKYIELTEQGMTKDNLKAFGKFIERL